MDDYITTPYPLVLIEWEDSRQPTSSWAYISTMDTAPAVSCVSVGWLVRDNCAVKLLASNLGDIGDADSMQASGVISIPARCIVRIVELRPLTSSNPIK